MRTETKDLNYYLDLAYKIEITPEVDADGTGFNAEIPLLKGCMAFGETVEEAYEMLMEVKQAWFDIALKRGWKIPESLEEDPLSEEALSWQSPALTDLWTHTEVLNGAISVPLEAREVEALEQVAEREGVSHSNLIRQWVQEKLASLSVPSELMTSRVAAD